MRAIDLKNVVVETNLSYPLYNNKRGEVRDNYDLGDRLLMVSTDRISASEANEIIDEIKGLKKKPNPDAEG